MLQRIASLVLILVIVIGGGILVYRFLNRPSSPKVKVLTITSAGKFSPGELKLTNDEVLRIKNQDKKNHTVKKVSDNATVAEIDQGAQSRELTLTDNTKTEVYLAGAEATKATITVGTPPTPPSARDETKTEAKAVQATNNNNKPLPNTGQGEDLIYLGLIVAGFALFKLSNRLLKNS